MGLSIVFIIISFIILLIYAGARLESKKKTGNRELKSARKIIGWVFTAWVCLTFLVSIHLFFVKVPPGHVGIPVVFGNVGTQVYGSGLHVKSPIANITKMSIQERRLSMVGKYRSTALSKDGMKVGIDVSWQYKIKSDKCAWILRNKVFTDISAYQNDYVFPELRRVVRDVVTDYTAQDLYTEGRVKAGKKMFDLGNKLLDKNGCLLIAVNLREVTLPDTVTVAIEKKKKREQESQEYDYKLEVERKEAERKAIEAEGIKRFQLTVVEGVTPSLLKWRSLEVAEKIAESGNSKVVFFGGENPPFILGGL